MKSLLAALALASTATASSLLTARQNLPCILDTVTTPSQSDVQASIVQWNADVFAVNTFLNIALTLDSDDLASQAATALLSAQDEPCQLATLSNDANIDGFATDAFTCAVSDLGNVFGPHVIDNLNKIIQFPTDTVGAHAAVNDINFFRKSFLSRPFGRSPVLQFFLTTSGCCHVLPDATILWTDAAEEDGVGDVVNKVAPLENACASISCSGVTECNTLDNGGF
jgi:hypothetical protein